jgi:hypothetical protein
MPLCITLSRFIGYIVSVHSTPLQIHKLAGARFYLYKVAIFHNNSHYCVYVGKSKESEDLEVSSYDRYDNRPLRLPSLPLRRT